MISEGRFLPMRGKETGHAFENIMEFLASFISLCSEPITPYVLEFHKNTKILEGKKPGPGRKEQKEWDFNGLFLLCIDKIFSRLLEMPEISRDSLIFKLLKDRRKEIEDLIN